ncbi:MAG: LacI family DNA-binding transcriptional regulator [Propionibacteriaceae bacterium]|jgi:DNA-binding LacI/PurR family transcriptional regulator|nr:LacI family DNA-binding transcriptional regulator [Propionibacteriaceae bacterium]
MVSLRDVAEASGVSLGTASKVMNGRPGVGAAKRDEILAIAKQLGYQQRESKEPAKLIDLVMRGMDSPWSLLVLAGVEAEAARAGAGVVVSVSHGREVGNRPWLDRLSKRHSDGLVLVVSQLGEGWEKELERLRIPYVLVDPVGAAPPGVPTVAASNVDGGRQAVEHLAGLGHRKIGIISGVRELACSQERLDGFNTGMARAGLKVPASYVAFGNFHQSGGYRQGLKMLSQRNRPTAIFAGSDLQALGVYKAAAELGLRIPEDLSVVGFDDSLLSDWMIPGLTTIRQPLEDMARQATRILLQMNEGTEPVTDNLTLATSLVVRGSTAAPK